MRRKTIKFQFGHIIIPQTQFQPYFSLGEIVDNSGIKLLASTAGYPEDAVEKLVRSKNSQVWFNNFGIHASVSYYSIIANALLRQLAGNQSFYISVFNHPFDLTINDIDAAAFQQASTDTLISICIVRDIL